MGAGAATTRATDPDSEAALSIIDIAPAASLSPAAALEEVDAALVQLQALQADAGPLSAASLQIESMEGVSLQDATMQETSIEPAAVADLEVRALRLKDELLARALRESPGDGLETGR
jgi:hypothetical protein